MHICVGKLIIIGSDNGLSPGRRQAIIWTYDGILSIGPLGTNVNEILIEIYIFSFRNIHLKMSSAKWRLFRLGLTVLLLFGILLLVLVHTNSDRTWPAIKWYNTWHIINEVSTYIRFKISTKRTIEHSHGRALGFLLSDSWRNCYKRTTFDRVVRPWYMIL